MPNASSSQLDDALMRATRGLRRRWFASLEPWNLTPHQARALHVVGELGGARLGAIAERLHITPRSTTEVIDGLQAHGLVARVPDEADRRATCVVLTDKGTEVLGAVSDARANAAEDYFAALTQDDRVVLIELLGKLPRRPKDA